MNILMPQLGETVAEGRVAVWRRAVGDTVAKGDTLFELETDKTSMDVPAIVDGVLAEIRVPAGEIAPVGAVVAVLAETGAAAEAAPPSPAPKSVAAPLASNVVQLAPAGRPIDPFQSVRTPERNYGPAALPSGVRSTPLARRLAAQASLDLSTVRGSGPHGRIVAADVRQHEARPAPASAAALASGLSLDEIRALYADVPHAEVELDGMRRAIAGRLVESKQTIPHFYLVADVDLSAMLALRREANGGGDVKLSVNDFVVRAYALALRDTPAANAVWAGARILRFQRVDVGIAVAVDGGLLTPVVRDAGAKNLSAISAEIRDLAVRARARRLQPGEYRGGAGAVSNLGMYGVRQFSAIISPPHATILAVGAAGRRPIEAPDGSVRFSDQMTVTLSCDHRVVDGAVGAELLSAFKTFLEQPLRLLL